MDPYKRKQKPSPSTGYEIFKYCGKNKRITTEIFREAEMGHTGTGKLKTK
jgi:hypothetical protein